MEGTNVFEEKLAGLLEEAKKKKNVLEYQEIISYFGSEQPTSDQMDQLFDFLEQSKVDIIRMDSAQELDPDLFIEEEISLEEEEEIDVEHLDLSVPEGVSLEDPVRMYLRKSARFPCCPWRRRLNWPRAWSWAARMQENVWQNPTCAWWSALPSDMWGGACSS